MEMEIVSIVFGVIGVVGAIVFGYIAFARGKKHDTTDEARQDGAVLTELGYIKSGVDDIKRKQEKQDQQHIEVISRLTVVEESAKQAHKRIDRIVDKN